MIPDTCTGAIAGLLQRGSPVLAPCVRPPVHDVSPEPCVVVHTGIRDDDSNRILAQPCAYTTWRAPSTHAPERVLLHWSDPTALLHAALYLESKGHPAAWMLPEGMLGGKVPAHAGMTAHEVSAVLLARSVRRVAAGVRPVRHLLNQWGADLLSGPSGPTPWSTRWVIGGARRIGSPRMLMVGPTGWHYDAAVLPSGADTQAVRYMQGPEAGEEGRKAADAAALADGCSLLTADGILLPPLSEGA